MLGAHAGCSSGPDGGILTDQAAKALSEQLLQELESSATPEERQAREDTRLAVEGYAYGQPVDPASLPPATPGVPRAVAGPEDEAHLYKQLGVVALFHGSAAGALWASLQAVRRAPGRPEYLSQAGAILGELGRHEPALAFLRKASHLEPHESLHRMSMAASLAETGERDAAAAELEAAREAEPDHRLLEGMLLDVYLGDLPAARALREDLHTRCSTDLEMVSGLASAESLRAFTTAMSSEVSVLTGELLDLYGSMPLDLPEGLMERLDEIQEEHVTRFSEDHEAPLDARTAAVQEVIDAEIESTAQTLADCNAATNYACTCAYDHCVEHLELLRGTALPATQEALRAFLPGSVRLLRSQELAVVGELFHRREELPPAALGWVLQLTYAELQLQCKTLSLDYGYALSPFLTHLDVANLYCTFEEGCRSAEEEARQEAIRRAIEEQREAEALLLKLEAWIAQLNLLEPLQLELCFVVGCLGVDGSQLSLKLGGPLAASFTLDLDRLAVGARIHLGLADPTGNLIGGEVSVGGDIGLGGSTFDVRASQSALFGTLRSDTYIYRVNTGP